MDINETLIPVTTRYGSPILQEFKDSANQQVKLGDVVGYIGRWGFTVGNVKKIEKGWQEGFYRVTISITHTAWPQDRWAVKTVNIGSNKLIKL